MRLILLPAKSLLNNHSIIDDAVKSAGINMVDIPQQQEYSSRDELHGCQFPILALIQKRGFYPRFFIL